MKYKLFKDIHFNPLHPPPPAHHAAAISKTAAGLLPHGDCGTGRMQVIWNPKGIQVMTMVQFAALLVCH